MPKKILIVDDEEDITERMSKIVSREGYHPLTASDGTYALEILKTESVDLVLADNSMQDLDGIKLMGIILGKPAFFKSGYVDNYFNGNSQEYDAFVNSHKSTLLLMMSKEPPYVEERLRGMGCTEVHGCFQKTFDRKQPFDEAQLVKMLHQYLSQ